MSVTVAYHQQTLHAASEARARSLRDTVARLSRPTSTEQSTKGTPLIPNPGLFVNVSPESSFASTDANTSEASSSKDPSHQDPAINSLTLGVSLPTIAECAIHLELLLCFTAFHRRVDNSTALDKAFSITPRPKIVRRYDNPAKKIRDPTFDVRRKLKWPAVLNIAVDRFLLWIRKVDAEMTQLSRDEWSTLFPPPIDVLMVWHSALLNPSYYRKMTSPLKNVGQVSFPWANIFEAIDKNKHSFNPPHWATTKFEIMTGLTADIFEEIKQHSTYEPIALSLAKMIEPTITAAKVAELGNTTSLTFMPGADTFWTFCKSPDNVRPEIKEAASAVTRQYIFCQKMELQLWSRSPVALDTMRRSRIRYARFLKLFQLYPRIMLVPTLDIDLVWHTHQLSHDKYVVAMKALTGKFIDHDDKIGKPVLDDGMQRTSDLYQVRFGSKYQECNCWDCETLFSELDKAAATAMEQGIKYDTVQQKVLKEVNYYRVAELSRRKAGMLPDRYFSG